MAEDPANVHCEGHAIKGFQTLINRRLFTSRKKRAAWLLLVVVLSLFRIEGGALKEKMKTLGCDAGGSLCCLPTTLDPYCRGDRKGQEGR